MTTNIYHFRPEDDCTINVIHKISDLMTKITFGIKQGKSFEVIVREVEDEHQPNPENT